MITQMCSRCGKEKPLSGFHKNGQGGYRLTCKECRKRRPEAPSKRGPSATPRSKMAFCEYEPGPERYHQGKYLSFFKECEGVWQEGSIWIYKGKRVEVCGIGDEQYYKELGDA